MSKNQIFESKFKKKKKHKGVFRIYYCANVWSRTFISASLAVINAKTATILVLNVPGHALHEQGLQRQKGVGPLVSRHGQRAFLVPRINRLPTACQPVILFPHSVYIGFRLFVLLERCSSDVSTIPWRVRGTLVSWADCSVGVQS